ncbi:MAG: hypothetical protein B7Y80_02825 [Hyphomicrobium sp. 32-62-53]|nr:MAG: hypothetical protein B7Z29_03175 [Hyphomicrobium sp. 12-62-95]OYY01667.1 MAG: hypothetical protein B7Y80_02825 [Hyphomicrobium sp. 32-62-53]
MSKNDVVVLKSNFENWKQRTEELTGVDPWLYYCLEQFLKVFSLDDEEMQFGLTEGGNDGGADGIYIIANQRQLVTEDAELDAGSVSKIRILFFQVKTSGGFKPTEIEKWIQLTDDFFDLTKKPESFGLRYNSKVKALMQIWREQYLRLSSSFPELKVDYYYITGADAQPDDYAKDSGERVKAKATQHVKGNPEVHFVGAQELWEQVQKRPPKSKTLIWAEAPMSTQEGFVGLVRLGDFRDFLEDDSEPGMLAERIFESNVRGFQQESSVNEEIAKSLEQAEQINFWLLNNGVTIIASKAQQASHLHLSIEDPQIVNGLQTSRSIFKHFSLSPLHNVPEDRRAVLVRVIPTSDQAIQDRIIRATNSQNKMLPASLRMTDQIHRDIEELFKRADLFYDRRKGFYRDQGKPAKKIISVNAVAQAVISILLQRPDDARARPGNYFKDDTKYASAFDNPRIPPPAYLICVQLLQKVERSLHGLNVDRADQKNIKFYVAALLARELTGLDKPVYSKLPSLSGVSEATIGECYRQVDKIYRSLSQGHEKDAVARGPLMLEKIDKMWKRRQVRDR